MIMLFVGEKWLHEGQIKLRVQIKLNSDEIIQIFFSLVSNW